MATIADYVSIAWAVYHSDIDLLPVGHTVPGWSCKIWEEGTFFSNGFQGGV